IVVNPRSANGRTGRDWPGIEGRVRDAYAPETVLHTEYAGHATVLVRELLDEGYTQIASVGGDGTHHEVVNGFFRGGEAINPAARMAIVPQGTGSDLARSFGLRSVEDALAALREGQVTEIDV